MLNEFLSGGVEPEALLEMSGKPEKFYCACGFKNHMGEWFDRELPGLEGLSVDPDFINKRFLDLRHKALAVFPFEETFNQNDIVAIRYQDAEFLVQDNFLALRRIANSDIRDVVREVIRKVATMADFNLDEDPFMTIEMLKQSYRVLTNRMDSSPTRSVDQVVDVILETAGEMIQSPEFNRKQEFRHLTIEDVPEPEDIGFMVEGALKNLAGEFQNEQEWLVRDEVFNVPEETVLVVGEDVRKDIETTAIQDFYDFIFVQSVNEAKREAKGVQF